MRVLVLLLTMLATREAVAVCASPAGAAGELRYISPLLEFCDGSSWQSTVVNSTATSCSLPGEIKYASGVLTFCNGSKLVQMNGPTDGTCAAGQAGTFTYKSSVASEEYCNGTNWLQMHAAASAATLVQQMDANAVPSSAFTYTTAAFSSAVTTGNLVVCSFTYPDNYSVASVTDSKGNTWARVSPRVYANTWSLEIWYAQNVTGGSSFTVSPTYQTGGNGKQGAYSCAEFSNVVSTNALDQGGTANGTTDTASPGVSLTTTSARELLYTVTIENNLCTPASGWTNMTGGFGDLIQYKTVSSVGTYAMGTGSGCGSWWNMATATFRTN